LGPTSVRLERCLSVMLIRSYARNLISQSIVPLQHRGFRVSNF